MTPAKPLSLADVQAEIARLSALATRMQQKIQMEEEQDAEMQVAPDMLATGADAAAS